MDKFSLQQLTFNNISNWPLATKWLIIVLANGVLLLVGYCLLINDLSQTLADEKQQYHLLQQASLSKQQAIKNLPVLQKQAQLLRAAIAAQIQQSNIDNINQLGTQADVHFSNIKLLAEKPNVNFIALPVQLTLNDNYQQIRLFLDKLVAANISMGINSFIIQPPETNFLITIYQLPQQNKKNINPINNNRLVTDIAADPFHAAVTNTLESFPLHTLHLVGVVQQASKTWALVMAPDSKVYPVTVGTHLNNESEVTQIDANKIIINKNSNKIIMRLAGKS